MSDRNGRRPVRSMTGFAATSGHCADGAGFTLMVKSVNHRFLDLALRLPAGCEALEMPMRRLLKERVERGHVEVTFEIERGAGGGVARIDDEALDAIVSQLRTAARRLALTGEPELSALLRLPGIMTTADDRPRRRDEGDLLSTVLPALALAMGSFDTVREREGEVLATELRCGMERLRMACAAVTSLRGGVRQAQFKRLGERLQELLAGTPVSDERLLMEAALLTEKSDVEEEAVRLRAHIDRFLAILDEGGAVGKRLDFLLQELQREANTLLSKTGSAAGPDSLQITELGLAMKTEIERAREQVQNLE